MKAVILAGGLGTRLAEETAVKPKPLVEIGGAPILWHIMKSFAHFGHKDFYVALGYKAQIAKDRVTLITCTNATGTHKIPTLAAFNLAHHPCHISLKNA